MLDQSQTSDTPRMKETDADRDVKDGVYRVAASELRAFIERIERLDAEKKDIADQTKEVFAEAKGIRIVKAECGRRIYAVADQIAQMNLTAAASAGRMTAPQMTTWQTALQWVDDMRATCTPLIADAEAEYLADDAWPDVPDGVAELAALF